MEKKSHSIPKAVIPGKLQFISISPIYVDVFTNPKVMYKNGTKNKANSLLKWRFGRRRGWPSTFQLQWGT